MSATVRPRPCSRTMYAASRSSEPERANRNEKGLRRNEGALMGMPRSYRRPRTEGALLGPLERGVRDRVAVGVVRRIPERLVDPLLELLADHVLEPVGLVVDGVDVQAERLREVELEQPVVADHLERDLFAVARQVEAAVRLVLEQLERRELLDHRARRGGRDVLRARQRRDRQSLF